MSNPKIKVENKSSSFSDDEDNSTYERKTVTRFLNCYNVRTRLTNRSKKDQNTLREESKIRQKLLRSQMKDLFAQLATAIRPPLDPKTEKTKAIMQHAIDYIHHLHSVIDQQQVRVNVLRSLQLSHEFPSSPISPPTQHSSPHTTPQIPTPQICTPVSSSESLPFDSEPPFLYPSREEPMHYFPPMYPPTFDPQFDFGRSDLPVDLFQDPYTQGVVYFEKSREIAPEDLPKEGGAHKVPNGPSTSAEGEKEPTKGEEEKGTKTEGKKYPYVHHSQVSRPPQPFQRSQGPAYPSHMSHRVPQHPYPPYPFYAVYPMMVPYGYPIQGPMGPYQYPMGPYRPPMGARPKFVRRESVQKSQGKGTEMDSSFEELSLSDDEELTAAVSLATEEDSTSVQ